MYVEMVLHFPRGISRLRVSFRGCTSVKHVFLRDGDQGICISYEHVTSPKKLTCPLKRDPLKRKVAFQPSFCRGCDSFRGFICVYNVLKASNPSLKHWMEVQFLTKDDQQREFHQMMENHTAIPMLFV